MKKESQMPTPEKMSKIQEKRTKSDAHLLEEGAKYKFDKEGKIKTLEITEEQREKMESTAKYEISKNKQVVELEQLIESLIKNSAKNRLPIAKEERLTEKKVHISAKEQWEGERGRANHIICSLIENIHYIMSRGSAGDREKIIKEISQKVYNLIQKAEENGIIFEESHCGYTVERAKELFEGYAESDLPRRLSPVEIPY